MVATWDGGEDYKKPLRKPPTGQQVLDELKERGLLNSHIEINDCADCKMLYVTLEDLCPECFDATC
jgi:uncharacterized OB-fold protein